jgi:isopenicillin N synthase-like dioxygenase
MSSSSLPIVDLSNSDRAALLRSVDAACSDLGFFMLSGHGVADAVIDRTYQAGLAFFDQPLEQKLAVARPAADVSRGYNRLADQSHAATFGEKPVADLQESFGLGPLDGRMQAKAAEAATAFAPNLWPRQPAEFRPVMELYYREMERLALALMSLFAQTLKLPPDFFERYFVQHASILRLVHYPAQPTPPAPGQLRAGPHTDFGTLTILRIDDAAGGLQVRDRSGNWIDIKARSGSLIVNIGDLMQRWTGDRWTSSIHRVVNPPRERADGSRRQSLVFFHEPDPDALVRSLPIDGRRSDYLDIVAAAHRLSRVRALRGLEEQR